MSPSLGSNLGWILPYLSLVSQVSLIKSVFGGTQMMLGTNSQSVMPPMSVKIVLDNLLQCELSHVFNLCCLVEESQCGGISQLVFHFPREEERNRTLYPTTPCLRHALPDYTSNCRQQVQGERRAALIPKHNLLLHLIFMSALSPYKCTVLL